MKSLFARHSPFRIFFVAFITIASLVLVYVYMGPAAAFVAFLLMIIEITFSFDNAIINARVLATMSPFWQKMFITIVMFSASLPWQDVINLALNDPNKYAEVLHKAHPSIASFGGMFLLMLTLHFFFDNLRTIHWLGKIERPMQVVGRKWLHGVVCSFILIILTFLPINHHPNETIIAGLAGIITYAVIHGLSEIFTKHRELTAKKKGTKMLQATGMAGFISFMYLEVLDASFSFDGVIGAFAVNQK